MERKSEFWHFSQNNSGGHFSYDLKKGITHHVVIEAKSKAEVLERASKIGLYFDGVASGMGDCPCCGDRWYEPCAEKGETAPSVYGRPYKQWNKNSFGGWMKKGREVCVHYLNGKKAWA